MNNDFNKDLNLWDALAKIMIFKSRSLLVLEILKNIYSETEFGTQKAIKLLDRVNKFNPDDYRYVIKYAILMTNIPILEKLIKIGYDVNYKKHYLITAIQNNNIELVKFLIKNKININSSFISHDRDDNGNEISPLLIAIKIQSLPIVKLLVENGAVSQTLKGCIYIKDMPYYLYEPIHYAIVQKNLEIFNYLIEKKFILKPSVLYAILTINVPLFKNMLEIQPYEDYLNSTFNYALCNNYDDLELIQLLVQKGANINYIDSYKGSSLTIACKNNDITIIEYLISIGFDVNNQAGHSGWTPLMSAVSRGRLDVVHLLLANGADKTLINSSGWNALSIAVDRNRTAIINLLE
jgi:ankyrin repeat protein